ncbi:hypothetical protein STENM327S_07810 [Streptomyces tendae]
MIGLGLELARRIQIEGPLDPVVFALDTDSSVVEYTTFSAACQSRAYCRILQRQVGLGVRGLQKPVTLIIRRP